MVFVIGALASGVAAAPKGPAPQAPDASGGSVATAMAGIIATDRQMVAAHLDPPEIIDYDLQISAMLPEGQDIIAKHDKVRGEAWKQKYNAIMKARYDAIQRFSAASIAASNMITNTFGGIRRPVDRPHPQQTQESAPGFSDWCQSPENATQLVPCNH